MPFRHSKLRQTLFPLLLLTPSFSIWMSVRPGRKSKCFMAPSLCCDIKVNVRREKWIHCLSSESDSHHAFLIYTHGIFIYFFIYQSGQLRCRWPYFMKINTRGSRPVQNELNNASSVSHLAAAETASERDKHAAAANSPGRPHHQTTSMQTPKWVSGMYVTAGRRLSL